MSDWKEYFEQTKNKPPRPLLVQALEFVGPKNRALDLGAGALNDTLYLLLEGFGHVVAVDKEPIAQEVAGHLPPDRFEYLITTFDVLDLPQNKYNLINAQYALPFTSTDSIDKLMTKIKESLSDKGVLTGQLFGDRDDWSSNKKMNFHTKEEAQNLLQPLTILKFEEEERDGPTAAGSTKHWHIFNFICRKD